MGARRRRGAWMKNSQKNRKPGGGVYVHGDGSCSSPRPFVSGKYPRGVGFCRSARLPAVQRAPFSLHRSASFARARFTITKSDWPAINLGRNLCRWAYHDGTYSYVKELERSGNAWRPAHAAQRRLNALGGTRSLLSKPSNGTPRPVRGVLLFYSTVHPPYGHPPYGVPWSASNSGAWG